MDRMSHFLNHVKIKYTLRKFTGQSRLVDDDFHYSGEPLLLVIDDWTSVMWQSVLTTKNTSGSK